jgi:hypothetical protein
MRKLPLKTCGEGIGVDVDVGVGVGLIVFMLQAYQST